MKSIPTIANEVSDFIKAFGIDVSVSHSTNRHEQQSSYISCKIGEIRISDHSKAQMTSDFSFVNKPADEIIEALEPVITRRIAQDQKKADLINSAAAKLTDGWKKDFQNINRPKTEDARAIRKQNFIKKYNLTEDEFKILAFVR